MKKQSRRQFRSHRKYLSALQLQIISFDNIIIWTTLRLDNLHLEKSCLLQGHWQVRSERPCNSPVPAGVRHCGCLGTEGSAPSCKTAHPCSAFPSKRAAICNGLANLYGNTRSRGCNLPGEAMQIMRLVKKRRKWEGEPVLWHPAPARQAPLEGSKKQRREQLLEDHLWTRKGWLLKSKPQLGVVLDFPWFHREQRSRFYIPKWMTVVKKRQDRTDC